VPVSSIGDVMTILGATTNSAIGFLLPIIFYLHIEKNAPRYAPQKVVAYVVFVVTIICSIIELGTFVYKKVNP
jgi:hypothetical protein